MKKLFCLIVCLCLLCGCSATAKDTQSQYTATFLELFDTVTTVVGRDESEAAFKKRIEPLHDELERYHKLFDIYEEYEGINNIKTLNDNAHKAPVVVDTAILDLLDDCITYYNATDGMFNPAMGSVLRLWHTAREDGIDDPKNAYLPDEEALKKAAEHTDPAGIVIDRQNSTVFFTDKDLKIDVGAIAKGWAVQKACQNAPKGLLLSVGGNIYATGPKADDGTAWSVGITNPFDNENYLHTLNITDGSVVTSGDYIRTYEVDGKLYHHIIDPNTLYPGKLWSSVTIVCKDSGVADMLSTALFLLDKKDGQLLLDKYDAEALWVDSQGKKYYSTAFKAFIRN